MVTVSVLFPVHNENDYVQEALQSIIKQDFTDLEILVLDSTRASNFASLQKVDSRIRYIRVPEVANLSMMLNIGIRNSKGKFIARMDSDDISLSHRITSQVRFMMKNPEVMILGGGIRFIGEESSHKAILGSELNIPQSNDNYFEYLLYKNPLFHPTVMFRSSIFTGGMNYYNEKFERSQDLELWVRLCRNFPIRNLQSIVLEYRVHENQSGRLSPSSSQHFSILSRIKHSCWIFLNYPSLRLRSAKNIVSLCTQLLKNLPNYLVSK